MKCANPTEVNIVTSWRGWRACNTYPEQYNSDVIFKQIVDAIKLSPNW